MYLGPDHVRMKKLPLHWAKVASLTPVVPEYGREDRRSLNLRIVRATQQNPVSQTESRVARR